MEDDFDFPVKNSTFLLFKWSSVSAASGVCKSRNADLVIPK